MSVERVAVLGAGGWGTAVAVLLARDAGANVSLWCRNPQRCQEIRSAKENSRLLPGVAIPDEVCVSSSLIEATSGAGLWVIAVPMLHLREVLAGSPPEMRAETPCLSLCKGIEPATGLRPSELIAELFAPPAMAVLSGPSHAEEVATGLPGSVVVASNDDALAMRIQELFTTEVFRVYTSDDVAGVELGGALKNVIGIAAGICDGLGFGDNAKSALLTRALVEVRRFGVACGARAETFDGLAGMGDLITTCFSPHGRNRRLGERVGKGEPLADILADFNGVAEGVETCRAVHQAAGRLGLEMPIVAGVHSILFEGKATLRAVGDLMMRPPKGERDPATGTRPPGQIGGGRV